MNSGRRESTRIRKSVSLKASRCANPGIPRYVSGALSMGPGPLAHCFLRSGFLGMPPRTSAPSPGSAWSSRYARISFSPVV